jgi:hypothetical protein
MRIKFCAFRAVLPLALLSLVLVQPLWAGPVTTLQSPVQDTWYTGGATLASNAAVVSTAVTLTNPGYREAWCTFAFTGTTGTPVAGTTISVWLRVSTDGTTFPDGDASIVPADLPSMVFPVRAFTGAQSISAFLPRMPTGVFRVRILNDGTGATLNTAYTLKCKTQTPQF